MVDLTENATLAIEKNFISLNGFVKVIPSLRPTCLEALSRNYGMEELSSNCYLKSALILI